jgi:ketosteroid isomerase-like protein
MQLGGLVGQPQTWASPRHTGSPRPGGGSLLPGGQFTGDTWRAMSRENVVRKPLSAREGAGRAFDERLALRFPRAFRALGRLCLRLSTKSRIRQALIWRSVAQGLGAANRRDFDAVLPRYHPDVEIQVDPVLLGLGDIRASYRGHQGYRQLYDDWLPAWGDGFQFRPQELIDLGDGRLLALMGWSARGQSSGIELSEQVAMLWTLDDEARVLRERHFFDWAEALEAVGLRE